MDERSFLSRWSRRKALRQEELDEAVLNGEQDTLAQQPDAAEAQEEKPPLTDEDMPPIETMGEDDNYGDFLSPKVSEKLRKAALRKLFHGAGFNIRDGLDDYDEDFTFFEPLGDIVTADMRHREEMLERKAREAAEAAKQADNPELTEEESGPYSTAPEEPAEEDLDAGEKAADESDDPTEEPKRLTGGDPETEVESSDALVQKRHGKSGETG